MVVCVVLAKLRVGEGGPTRDIFMVGQELYYRYGYLEGCGLVL